MIWPWDTFVGFRRLGFGIVLSFLSMLIIHGNFSYPTALGWLPDPFFRIRLDRIHRDKHGSDTGTYDAEGRFLPQKFEDMFAKYAEGRDHLTLSDVWALLQGQRCIMDPVGWGGAFFECESEGCSLFYVLEVRGVANPLCLRVCNLFTAVAGRRSHDEGRYQGYLRWKHIL